MEVEIRPRCFPEHARGLGSHNVGIIWTSKHQQGEFGLLLDVMVVVSWFNSLGLKGLLA